jgi:PAS domain S-box-containing protein
MVGDEMVVSGIYLGASVVALLVAGLVLWNRQKKAALPLGIAGIGATLWAGGLFLSTMPWEAVAILGIRITYIGVSFGPAAMLLFALEYTGRERYVTRRLLAVLAIHPIVLLFFVFVNPGHLFFVDLDPSAPIGVEQDWGIAFWIHSIYGYLLSAIPSLLILELLVKANRGLYTGQSALLTAGVLVPLPLNVMYLADMVQFDTTPLGFVVGFTFFGVAIVRYQLINIAPIAHERVIDTVRDGMVVVDTDDQIVESNPAARDIIGVDEEMVGSTIEEVFSVPAAISAYEALVETREPTEATTSYGELHVKTQSTPIYDDRDRHIGWLFLMQDISEQKRRERDLEQQIEKLDQFASLVSHDLRNPINVARGYIQQAQATGDVDHLEKAAEATVRMEEIIDDALTLAREGQEVTDPVSISLESVVREGWQHVETDGAELVVEGDTTVVADGDRLQRLFENLFRNAIEHGTDAEDPAQLDPADLTVTVGTTDETQTETTLFVADDGIGIPPKDRDQVFDDGYTTGESGTGLGLTIIEQIAHAHDWDVSVTESTDGGARFEVSGVSKPL